MIESINKKRIQIQSFMLKFGMILFVSSPIKKILNILFVFLFIAANTVYGQQADFEMSFEENLNPLNMDNNKNERYVKDYSIGINGLAWNLSENAKSRMGVTISDSLINNTPRSDFCVMVWVKTEKNALNRNIILSNKNKRSEDEAGWMIAARNNGSWMFNISDGENKYSYKPTIKKRINDGKWHQLGYSIDVSRKEVWLYYDGETVAIYNMYRLDTLFVSGNIYLGSEDGTAWKAFKGYIDELKIWKEQVDPTVFKDNYFQYFPIPPLRPEPVEELKVMSWNIWHGGHEHGEVVGVERVIDIIKESGADVISMQETYGSAEEVADALGYVFYLRSSNLSIMSRFPILETFDIYNPFNVGAVTIRLGPERKINFYTIWLHYLPDYWIGNLDPLPNIDTVLMEESTTRLKEINTILNKMSHHIFLADHIPVIMAGDFNSSSHLDWTKKTASNHGGLVVEWSVSKAIGEAGFVDSYRAVYPNPKTHPGRTWSPIFTDQLADRIDYIYYKGKSLEAYDSKMIDSHLVKFPSDHATVVTSFKLK